MCSVTSGSYIEREWDTAATPPASPAKQGKRATGAPKGTPQRAGNFPAKKCSTLYTASARRTGAIFTPARSAPTPLIEKLTQRHSGKGTSDATSTATRAHHQHKTLLLLIV